MHKHHLMLKGHHLIVVIRSVLKYSFNKLVNYIDVEWVKCTSERVHFGVSLVNITFSLLCPFLLYLFGLFTFFEHHWWVLYKRNNFKHCFYDEFTVNKHLTIYALYMERFQSLMFTLHAWFDYDLIFMDYEYMKSYISEQRPLFLLFYMISFKKQF